MTKREIQIEDSWKTILLDEFEKDYFKKIKDFLKEEIHSGKTIYPPGKEIFNAFYKTPFDDVKIVIIGQDPYHGPGQAMGLSFSVPQGIKIPASLKRIYAEMKRDVAFDPPLHGDLSLWAEQGVFLLNAMLTVEKGNPGSHSKIGWQDFTDSVIKAISDNKENIVFMLWGNFAKNKKQLIDSNKHHILESAHPSPLAGNAFQGCAHFSKANKILKNLGQKEINWQL